MSQFLEFVVNHPILFGLLAAVIAFMMVGEVRRKAMAGQVLNVPDTVRLMNDTEPQIVDIRSRESFQNGHIIGARSIPLQELKTAVDGSKLDQAKPVLLYCQMGMQSNQASQILKAAGFDEVYILQQGLQAWQQENLPLNK